MRHSQITPAPTPILAIRAVLVDRINEAAVQAQRLASPDVSMPSSLLAACMYAADQQVCEPCVGESYFGWTPADCRRYLDRLTPEQRAEEIAAGYRVLFVGSARRAPLMPLLADAA